MGSLETIVEIIENYNLENDAFSGEGDAEVARDSEKDCNRGDDFASEEKAEVVRYFKKRYGDSSNDLFDD